MVAQGITRHLQNPFTNEGFRDSLGNQSTNMSDLVAQVLYKHKPNIVTSSIQIPLKKDEGKRWSEHFKASDVLDDANYFHFTKRDELQKKPLRHSYFYTGMDAVRDSEMEDPDQLADHINKVIYMKNPFDRGFYQSMKSEPHCLPIPFPRFFTPFSMTEQGMKRPALTDDQKASGKHKDEFVLSLPTVVRLAQDGSYRTEIERAYLSVKLLRQVTKV